MALSIAMAKARQRLVGFALPRRNGFHTATVSSFLQLDAYKPKRILVPPPKKPSFLSRALSSDADTAKAMDGMTIFELQKALDSMGIDHSQCQSREDLVNLVPSHQKTIAKMDLQGIAAEDMIKAIVDEGGDAAELGQLSRVALEEKFQEYTQLWMRRGEDQATSFREGPAMKELLDVVLHGGGGVKDIIKVATDMNLELKNATVMIGGLLIEQASQSYNGELRSTYKAVEPEMQAHISKRRSLEAQAEEERIAFPPGVTLDELATDVRLPGGVRELQAQCETVTKLTAASAKLLFTYTLPSMVPSHQEGWLYLGPSSVASHVCGKFDADPNMFVFKNWAHTVYSILGEMVRFHMWNGTRMEFVLVPALCTWSRKILFDVKSEGAATDGFSDYAYRDQLTDPLPTLLSDAFQKIVSSNESVLLSEHALEPPSGEGSCEGHRLWNEKQYTAAVERFEATVNLAMLVCNAFYELYGPEEALKLVNITETCVEEFSHLDNYPGSGYLTAILSLKTLREKYTEAAIVGHNHKWRSK